MDENTASNLSSSDCKPEEEKWPNVTYEATQKRVSFELYSVDEQLELEQPMLLATNDAFEELRMADVVKPPCPPPSKTPAAKARKLNKKTPKTARQKYYELTGPSKTIVKLEPAKPTPLPETVFSEVDDYPVITVPERPASYYRLVFILKTGTQDVALNVAVLQIRLTVL
jgi:hypothetical protein